MLFLCNKADRKYVIQRRFNNTGLVGDYISSAKNIVCNNCDAIFEYDKLGTLEVYGMLCPRCRAGVCSVDDVVVEVPVESNAVQLPELDIQLLNSLSIDSPQYASSLAQELDCTYQKVSRVATKLKKAGLISVERKKLDDKIGVKTYYDISEKAVGIYFSGRSAQKSPVSVLSIDG